MIDYYHPLLKDRLHLLGYHSSLSSPQAHVLRHAPAPAISNDFLKNIIHNIGNIQIEGTAEIKGHPLADENSLFLEFYKESHFLSYQMYSHLEDEVVIEVTPTFITIWKYGKTDNKSYREFLDLTNNKAYREYNNID